MPTQSAQILQKRDERNIYAVMKTIFPPGCLHSGFVVTHALGQMMCTHVPKCMSCHKAIVVITRRAHCFHDYIYIDIYYPHTRVSSCPGLVSVARVNEYRTSDVIRVLKTPGVELSQNACGERTEKYFVLISVLQSAQLINLELTYIIHKLWIDR